jgi:hypothetical protein
VRVSDSGAIRSRLVLASERSATESNTREADLSPRRNMIAPW